MAITFVPGQGWVMDGGFNVSAGSQDIAYAQEQKAKEVAARRAMYGQYDQYMGQDNLDWLKNNIGDSWWWSVGRLPKLSHDDQWFWNEFGGRSDESYAHNAEIVNRYRALEESGMSREQIQQAIWGGANLSPTINNGGAGGGVTKPGMLSGGTSIGSTQSNNVLGNNNQVLGNNNQNSNQSNNQNNAGVVPNNGVTPKARQQRQGVWGSGYTDGGYGMLSDENNEMRQAIAKALEEKLLG